jgi:hypothetical protein
VGIRQKTKDKKGLVAFFCCSPGRCFFDLWDRANPSCLPEQHAMRCRHGNWAGNRRAAGWGRCAAGHVRRSVSAGQVESARTERQLIFVSWTAEMRVMS